MRLGNLLKVLHQVNCVARVLLSLKTVSFPSDLVASHVDPQPNRENSYIGKELQRM